MPDQWVSFIFFPEEFDWYYAPPTDLTKAITKQNKKIVDQSTAIDPNQLPSEKYESLLKGLFDS